MIDIERQIHDYYDQIMVPVTDIDVIRNGSPAAPPRRGVAVLAAGFILALAGIGVAALLMRGTQPIASQPIVTSPSSMVSHSTPTSLSPGLRVGTWLEVAVGAPWIESIVDVAALPDGGFIAASTDPWQLQWSPDGLEWFNADPERAVSEYRPGPEDGGRAGPNLLAVVSDQVVVLDRDAVGVWIGRPVSGTWTSLPLDTSDLRENVELLSVASSDSEAIVIAQTYGSARYEPEPDPGDEQVSMPVIDQYLMWVVDPAAGTATRYPLPVSPTQGQGVTNAAAFSFHDQWIILLSGWIVTDDDSAALNLMLATSDGVSWEETTSAEDAGFAVTSLTAGLESVIATECNFGGDTFWYSQDGLEWSKSTTAYLGHHSTFSTELGFIIASGDLLSSDDGLEWRTLYADPPLSGITHLTASGNKLLVKDGLRDDEEPHLWLWTDIGR